MMRMKVAWVLLIFMLFYHTIGADGDIHSMLRQLDEEENDPDISQADKDKLDEYRTELIKAEILKMLGLERAPNISNSPQVPRKMVDTVLRQTNRKRVNEDSASTEVIVVAEQDFSLESENSRKLFLRFHTSQKLSAVSSAILVVRRNPEVLTKKRLKKHRLFGVRISGVAQQTSKLFRHPKVIEISRHWIKLDISSILKSRGNDKMMQNFSVEVKCAECGSENAFSNSKKRRPFLILNVRAVTKLRKRRSAGNCGNGSPGTCCLETYSVSFKSMGYDWVIQPKQFMLNYCKGPCTDRTIKDMFLDRFQVFTPINKKSNPNNHCCVVKRLLPLSILFLDDDGNFQKKDVPDVTAFECECA